MNSWGFLYPYLCALNTPLRALDCAYQVEVVMVGFLLLYGCRLLSRIRRAAVFDKRNRKAMIQV